MDDTDIYDKNDTKENNAYLGTFRWKNPKFKSMKKLDIDDLFQMKDSISKMNGFSSFFEQRLIENELSNSNETTSTSTSTSIHPSMIDALSYPLSIVNILKDLVSKDKFSLQNALKFNHCNIVMFGCAERSEERIMKNSNYFDEIYYFIISLLIKSLESEYEYKSESINKHEITKIVNNFRLNLIMIGEEIKTCTGPLWDKDKITVSFFPYKVDKFLKEYNFELNKEVTIFVGFNCGFGAGYSRLTLDWINDLNSLLKLKHVCAFTFTNDYEDLKGEKLIMEYLKAKFVSINTDNSFKSMSTYKSEEKELNEWACGNYGYYIVHGNEKFVKVENQKIIDILKENKLFKS